METRLIPVMHENYRSRHLLDTSWCLVIFVLVEARSAVKLVYNTKTRCIEDQMRNHNGNLHKEAKALTSSKARPNEAQRRSTLEQRGSFLAITAFRKRSQTSPHNRLLQSNLALALNPVENFSWTDLMGLSS